MEDLAAVLAFCVDLMKIEFTIWGFTMSFWDILMWSLLAFIVIFLLRGVFGD